MAKGFLAFLFWQHDIVYGEHFVGVGGLLGLLFKFRSKV